MKALLIASKEPTFHDYVSSLVSSPLPDGEWLEPVFFSPEEKSSGLKAAVDLAVRRKPDLIHIQHEYGCFGSKVPFLYRFPEFLRELRSKLAGVPCLATAHTVLPADFRYPIEGRGWQKPLRKLANRFFVPPLMNGLWGNGTWGSLEGVVVHSSLQELQIAKSCKKVTTIPLFVPQAPVFEAQPFDSAFRVITFGYFTPEKGQDILLDALSLLGDFPIEMTFAGGLRRDQDKNYFETCLRKASKLSPQIKVNVTGFVSPDDLDRLAKQAHLAVAPFRDTSGSASLTYLIARGLPILTSDHPLNLDMATRVPGLFAVYPKDEPARLAGEIRRMRDSKEELAKLRSKSQIYAQKYSIGEIVRLHREYYAGFGVRK